MEPVIPVQNIAQPASIFDIPHNVILHHIFPLLPAASIYSSSTLGGHWEEAYINLCQDQGELLWLAGIQPMRGGWLVSGFLLETGQLTLAGRAGLRRQALPRIDAVFIGRSPRLIASHEGFLLIFLRHPDELVIWNPVGNQRLLIPIEDWVPLYENFNRVGMVVEVVDGAANSPRITIAFPFVLEDFGDDDRAVTFCLWTTDNQMWLPIGEAGEFFVLNYDPLCGVVNIDLSIYVQLAVNVISWLRVDPGLLPVADRFFAPNVPLMWDSLICNYQGLLGYLTVNVHGRLLLFTRQAEQWIPQVHLQLSTIVLQFRHVFGSRSVSTRNGPLGEPPSFPVSEAFLVGYVDGILIIHLRERWVSVNFLRRTARNVHLGPPPPPPLRPRELRLFPYQTSCLQLPLM